MCAHTWSCFPQMTWRGVVIRYMCSCRAYLDFSFIISLKTKKYCLKIRNRHSVMYIFKYHQKAMTEECIRTDLHDKSHCVEVVHPPVLEESKYLQHIRHIRAGIQIKHTSRSPLKFRKCVPVGGPWSVHGSKASAWPPSLEVKMGWEGYQTCTHWAPVPACGCQIWF